MFGKFGECRVQGFKLGLGLRVSGVLALNPQPQNPAREFTAEGNRNRTDGASFRADPPAPGSDFIDGWLRAEGGEVRAPRMRLSSARTLVALLNAQAITNFTKTSPSPTYLQVHGKFWAGLSKYPK